MIKNDKIKNDINLGMLIGQVHRLSTKKFVQNSHNSGLDISMDQWIVLGPIWENDGLSHKEISEYCLKDKTSVSINQLKGNVSYENYFSVINNSLSLIKVDPQGPSKSTIFLNFKFSAKE